MATINSQRVLPISGANLVVTIVRLTAASDSVSLPRMSSTSGKVAQLLRIGGSAVTVSQTSVTAVTLTGTEGQEILLVSHHKDPIPAPTGDGA